MEKKEVNVWFEMRKGTIPAEVEKVWRMIPNRAMDFPGLDTNFLTQESPNSLYFRAKGLYKNRKYQFTVFTGGWFHLPYLIYLEVNFPREVMPYLINDDIDQRIASKETSTGKLLFYNISTCAKSKVIIGDKVYYFRKSKAAFERIVGFDYYEFVPLIRYELAAILRNILKKIFIK